MGRIRVRQPPAVPIQVVEVQGREEIYHPVDVESLVASGIQVVGDYDDEHDKIKNLVSIENHLPRRHSRHWGREWRD
jgi:hypothetical protein